MEEMLGNVAGARQVFERWMKWEPDHNGWAAYIKVSWDPAAGGEQASAPVVLSFRISRRHQQAGRSVLAAPVELPPCLALEGGVGAAPV